MIMNKNYSLLKDIVKTVHTFKDLANVLGMSNSYLSLKFKKENFNIEEIKKIISLYNLDDTLITNIFGSYVVNLVKE